MGDMRVSLLRSEGPATSGKPGGVFEFSKRSADGVAQYQGLEAT